MNQLIVNYLLFSLDLIKFNKEWKSQRYEMKFLCKKLRKLRKLRLMIILLMG